MRKEKVTLANFVKYCEGKDLAFWEALCVVWGGVHKADEPQLTR